MGESGEKEGVSSGDAVGLQNSRGSKKRSAKGQEGSVAAGEGLREDVTEGAAETGHGATFPTRPWAPDTHIRGPRLSGSSRLGDRGRRARKGNR